MSLLTICQNVANEVGIAKPASFIGSTDGTAVRLLAQARRAGKWIAKKWDWQVLQKEATITTANNTASYALASDYDHHIDDTLWDRTNYWRLRGPMSPQEWQVLKSGIVTTGPRRRFRVYGDLMYIDPTPSSADTLVYEYVSDQWCQDTSSTGQADWLADTDTGIINENLIELETIWRVLKSLGMAYIEEKGDARQEIGLSISRDGGNPIVRLHGRAAVEGGVNVPEAGFG